MKETLNTDWSKFNNDNTDCINNTEWTKHNPFRYYHSLAKTNINREKELYYKKRKVKNWTAYQKER
jgi:hypothetical protein